MTIDTNLYTIDWIFLGSLAVLFLGQFYFYVRYMCAPARKMRKDHKSQIKNPDSEIDKVHGVSVVLCAHNEAYNISQYLQAILTQDYPEYEVIVVGGGHAGVEACHASAFKGHSTLLLTLNENMIANMPCNPHIGGSAKGVVVREVDARPQPEQSARFAIPYPEQFLVD